MLFFFLFSNLFKISDCHETLNGADETERYRSQKLGTTFNDRVRYVVHYENLKTYLKLGMKLVCVHRVLSFKQKPFLKKYIDFCTRKRIQSKTIFHKNLWNFFANANFGKFIERTRDHMECRIVFDEESAEKWVSSNRFKSMRIISENLIIVFLDLRQIVMNKAYAIGFTILERSKQFMYESFYNRIKPALGKCEVVFTDTDSFFIETRSTLKRNILKKLDHILDFSNYDPWHPKHSAKNQNALGYFKDEMKGEQIDEFVGLRSKTYAITTKKSMKSVCKGVRKGYRKTIPFKSFKNCLKKVSAVRVTQYNITSKMHKVETSKIRRLAFSSFDDKRFIFNCGIHSAPYGSKFIVTSGECYVCNENSSLRDSIQL